MEIERKSNIRRKKEKKILKKKNEFFLTRTEGACKLKLKNLQFPAGDMFKFDIIILRFKLIGAMLKRD